MLDPAEDTRLLARTIARYAQRDIDLDDLRGAVEALTQRWQMAPESEKPPFTPDEIPLWNAVWDITTACQEELARDAVAVHLQYLSGDLPLPAGTSALRP